LATSPYGTQRHDARRAEAANVVKISGAEVPVKSDTKKPARKYFADPGRSRAWKA
jgi:hypothetical protein